MHRQVGDLKLDDDGIAFRGLLVRHLVLPNNLAGSEAVLCYLADKVSKNTYVNIMAQYHPVFRAGDFPELNRRITSQEYQQVIDMAEKLGIRLNK